MRCDHPAGERDVGEILAEGVKFGVGRVGWTGEREALSGERRPAPDR